MASRTVWHFAYGSNMNRVQMLSRAGKILEEHNASLPNYEVRFNKKVRGGTAGANIQMASGKTVHGVLYKLEESTFRMVDRYEGVPEHYRRIEVQVTPEGGEPVPAQIYIASKIEKGLRPPLPICKRCWTARASTICPLRTLVRLRPLPARPDRCDAPPPQGCSAATGGTMATSSLPRAASRGGSFLVESCTPEDVFSPAELTDDQKLIGQTAEEFVRNEVVPVIPDLEQHKPGLLPQMLKKAGEIGLLGGGVPEEYGGAGLDKVSTVQLAEKLSAYASFGVSHGGHSGIGTLPIVFFGTEEQKKKYLPDLATGEKLACLLPLGTASRVGRAESRTRAVLSPDGKSWILNGQKMWITNGGFADVYIVFAKVDGEKFSCFIVERGIPGFSSGAEEKKMGLKGSSTTAIFFENCQVPKENLLHEIGRGHIVAFNILNAGRFSLGAYCTGGAKGILEIASKYAKERIAFGKSIGEFGLIRAKLAEMAIRIFAAESMVYRSAGLMDRAIAAAGEGADKTQQSMKVFEEYAIESSISKVYGRRCWIMRRRSRPNFRRLRLS